MKRSLALACLPLFWSAISFAAEGCPDAGSQAVEKAAIAKVEVLVATATTPEAGLSTFAPNAVQDDFFGPQRHGIAGIKSDFSVYMDNYSNFHTDILDMTIDTRCDLAVAYSHQHFTAPGKNGTPSLDAVVRQTDVLRKLGGKWLIVYQHLSVPVDLRSGRAVWKP